MSSANSVLFLTVLLSLSCLSAVLGQDSGAARVGNTGPSCNFRCDAGSYLIECGTDIKDKTSCKRKGCCWNPYLPPENPKCFKKNGGYSFCDGTRERESCIHKDEKNKISKAECERRNCCYDDSKGAEQDACFFRNTNYDPSCPYNERVQCGGKNLTKSGCLERGCCYSEVPECKMEPACFYSTEKLNQLKIDLNPEYPPLIPPISSDAMDRPRSTMRGEVKTEL